MDEGPATRASLVVRLQDLSDERAWSEFVELYRPLVAAVARRNDLQAADAADLEQEVFRAVAQAIDRYDPDPALGSFRGWLFRIARNLLLNGLAARRRHPQGTGDTNVVELLAAHADSAVGPDDTAVFEMEYRRRLFQWASERVRPQVQESTWLAFWRTAVEGRKAAEVAAELGLSVGGVYVHRNRVMSRIRGLIERIESGESE
jgi:RNA polymerase sigma-70 factor (ECF subfamily)